MTELHLSNDSLMLFKRHSCTCTNVHIQHIFYFYIILHILPTDIALDFDLDISSDTVDGCNKC